MRKVEKTSDSRRFTRVNMSDQLDYLSLASGESHTHYQPTWSTYKKLVHRYSHSLIVISLVSHQVAIVISSWVKGLNFKN